MQQDTLGVAVCFIFMRSLRIPSLRIAALLLSLMFFYDIFMVFLSPLFFPSSVMMTVATAGEPAVTKGSHGECIRLPGERMPMLFLIPRVSPTPGAPGEASSSVDPLVSPSSWMPESVAVSCAPARCWLARPGFGRPARIECIRTGASCSHASERQQRSTWPPPSSVEPSISSSVMAGIAFRLPGRAGT